MERLLSQCDALAYEATQHLPIPNPRGLFHDLEYYGAISNLLLDDTFDSVIPVDEQGEINETDKSVEVFHQCFK